MIDVQYANELPYSTMCFGCGKKNDDKGIKIEIKSPVRIRGTVVYLCEACRRELYEKI